MTSPVDPDLDPDRAPDAVTRSRAVPALAVAVLAVLFALAGCSSNATTAQSGTTTTTIGTSDGTVIDVRTPDEYAAGHLEGAVNVDVQSSDFEARLAALDHGAHYYVYCSSGNRSARAVARMRQLGFTEVTDLHGIGDAETTTGLPVVRTVPQGR